MVKIGRPPPPAAPKSGRGMRPVVPPKVAGQDSACRCGAGGFDATPPENLTQVFRSWGPRIPSPDSDAALLLRRWERRASPRAGTGHLPEGISGTRPDSHRRADPGGHPPTAYPRDRASRVSGRQRCREYEVVAFHWPGLGATWVPSTLDQGVLRWTVMDC